MSQVIILTESNYKNLIGKAMKILEETENNGTKIMDDNDNAGNNETKDDTVAGSEEIVEKAMEAIGGEEETKKADQKDNEDKPEPAERPNVSRDATTEVKVESPKDSQVVAETEWNGILEFLECVCAVPKLLYRNFW